MEHVDDYKVMKLIPSGVRVIASVPNFGDVAHLRVYPDEGFIVKRYDKYLNISQVFFSAELGIFVLIGIKK